MSWTLGELTGFCNGVLRGEPKTHVSGVSTDSRSIAEGELFVAVRGDTFDGHDYASEALDRGAAAVLMSRALDLPGATIRVDDTVVALGALASAHRERFHGPVVAITGSNGKTTTKEMCARILAASGLRVRRSPGNLNNHIGLPLSLLGLELDDDVIVVELGMNHEGEIAQLAHITSPTVGAITNVAPAHLGPLGSLEAIARAKGELFDEIRPGGTAIVNADDPHCVEQSERFAGNRLSFGRKSEADFRAREIASTREGESFELETEAGQCRVELRAPGAHLIEDALCAATAATATGLLAAEPLESLRRGLEQFEAIDGRLAPLSAPGDVTLFDDTYNANPESVVAALSTLAAHSCRGRSVAVLGDMLELGPDSAALHANVGREAAARGIQMLVAVGPLSAHAAEAAAAAGVSETIKLDEENAPARVRELVRPGDIVLVKGSRGMRMERVVSALMDSD